MLHSAFQSQSTEKMILDNPELDTENLKRKFNFLLSQRLMHFLWTLKIFVEELFDVVLGEEGGGAHGADGVAVGEKHVPRVAHLAA